MKKTKDSLIRYSKADKQPFISYYDENLFTRRRRALSRYFKKCHKYLVFDVFPKLMTSGKKEGHYSLELPTNELFEKVYGKATLKFTVKNDVAVMETIEPEDILDACYVVDLPVYKGIPYRDKKDLKKIKMVEAILCQKKEKNK